MLVVITSSPGWNGMPITVRHNPSVVLKLITSSYGSQPKPGAIVLRMTC